MASQAFIPSSPRARLFPLLASFSATGLGLCCFPVQGQCLSPASCGGISQSSVVGAARNEATSAPTNPIFLTNPALIIPITQNSGSTETSNTSFGGVNRQSAGTSTDQGVLGNPQVRLPGNANSAVAPNLSLGNQDQAPENPAITPALTTRLQPASLNSSSTGTATITLDGSSSSLWNSESILYKKDRTGSPCSINRQGPQINTCH